MKKRKILIGLFAFAALAVSSVLFASSEGGLRDCNETAKGSCMTRMDYSCYFFFQNARGISTEDRCWFDDHDFSSPV